MKKPPQTPPSRQGRSGDRSPPNPPRGAGGFSIKLESLNDPVLFHKILQPIMRRGGLAKGQERVAWEWRAHALRIGDDAVALFCWLMKNQDRASEVVTGEDEREAGLDMRHAQARLYSPTAGLNAKERYCFFLRTPKWFRIRKAMLRRAKYTCADCGERKTRGELDVHHLNYSKPWGQETEKELIVLCRLCHERKHGLPGNGGNVAEFVQDVIDRVDKRRRRKQT